ncbi:hypothetical protein L596_015234 [Steinernema carpocapsae]|uniref:Uncharacterized protein n=1 Tax=Steinernema carpocapsae TaxID=34508 RepID=A0A4U5NFN6_STECR|nr:hypothetical protein L596_015234 [Steinernema carpocapsae]
MSRNAIIAPWCEPLWPRANHIGTFVTLAGPLMTDLLGPSSHGHPPQNNELLLIAELQKVAKEELVDA